MDVKNDTEQDVDYKVVNGGTPMDGEPTPPDQWQQLAPGQCVPVPVTGIVVVVFRRSGAIVGHNSANNNQSVELTGPPFQTIVQDGLIRGS